MLLKFGLASGSAARMSHESSYVKANTCTRSPCDTFKVIYIERMSREKIVLSFINMKQFGYNQNHLSLAVYF